MQQYSSRKNSMIRVIAVLLGVVINVSLDYMATRLEIPLYLDTIGTIAVAFIGGSFPGVMTAVITNLVCMTFNPNALYYTFINALIAIFTSWFRKKYSFREMNPVIGFILVSACMSGIISGLIQWGLLGQPENEVLVFLVDLFQDATGISGIGIFLLVNVLLNILDKGLSVGLTLLLLTFVPAELRNSIRNSGWRQRPLSQGEVEEIDAWGADVPHSVRGRIVFMIVGISLSLVAIMGSIGITLYYYSLKAAGLENATSSTELAVQLLNANAMEQYLEQGERAKGYAEAKEMLRKIQNNSQSLKYIYVVQIREDGVYYIFDLDPGEDPYEAGERVDVEEAFLPYMPRLLAGEEIEAVESRGPSGWVMTVYEPMKDVNGKTVCYVGADVSLDYLATDSRVYLLKLFLILAGFFLLILTCGMWVSKYYTVYPLNSIAACMDGFAEAGHDQALLDAQVRKLRQLDIHTEDEVAKMYQALCDMASGMAEQMRDIRHYTDSAAQMQNGLIVTMADLVENRDSDTGAHIQKTAAYVGIILEGLKRRGYYLEKLTPEYMSDVVMSAPLHDVGKISIPDAVLNKPGKLTEEEYAVMKSHTIIGKNIMEKAISTVRGEGYLKEARNMAAYHHERWDGTGYPEGLHGEVIPLSARVMAVADVFDALTSARVYKKALSMEEALAMLKEGAGTQFDPKCVEAFVDSLPEVKLVLRKYQMR